MQQSTRLIYCAYGRAGQLVLNLLLERLAILPSNIFCFTYNVEENSPLVNALEVQKVDYCTKPVKKSLQLVKDFQPDVIVSMHYRDLIPGSVLEVASLGGFNLHPSLLPKYRGTFSAPWVIINGEAKTGVTYHYMNDKFDDGRIILQKAVEITDKDTGYSLFHKLIDAGVANFEEAFDLVVNQHYPGIIQKGEPTYYTRQVPFEGWINVNWSLPRIERFIRAMYFPPKPCAKVLIQDKTYEVNSLENYLEICRVTGQSIVNDEEN